MDLIGEMVVAKNALPYLAQRAENQFGQRELAREIEVVGTLGEVRAALGGDIVIVDSRRQLAGLR